jgi:hypothetical protein
VPTAVLGVLIVSSVVLLAVAGVVMISPAYRKLRGAVGQEAFLLDASVSLPGACSRRHLICVKLRVINNSDMVLTQPGVRSTVNSYKSIMYTADQVHPRGEKG